MLKAASALERSGITMINTGIEKADDSVSREKKYTIKVSKDVAAGAVLVFAGAAVFIGVVLLWQPEAFEMLFEHYVSNPVKIIGLLISFVVAFLFIFKLNNKFIRKMKKKIQQKKGKK